MASLWCSLPYLSRSSFFLTSSTDSKEPMVVDYIHFSDSVLSNLIRKYSLSIVRHDKSSMGEWYVDYDTTEFVLSITSDRSNHISIELGSKVRRKARAQMRGPWSMSHLKGYLDGRVVHYKFKDFNEEITWLEENELKLFDSALLNSDELNQWSVNASKKLQG